MRIRIILLLALCLSLLGANQADATPKHNDRHVLSGVTLSSTSSLLSRPHWRRSSGFQTVVRVIYRGPDTRWLDITKHGVAQWNRSGRIYMIMATGCPTGRNCVYVYTQDQGANGVLGTAVSCGGSGHLWTSTGSTCNRVVYNSHYPGSHDDKNLGCHELGHSIGLPHPADGSQGPCSGGFPKQLDFDELRTMYKHTDSAGPPGAARGV